MGRHKLVYPFAEGSRDMRDLLGGKGANVAEMTRVLGAERVPGRLHDHHRGLRGVHARRRGAPTEEQVAEALERLEEEAGKRLGDTGDPLLVSVRSGARESMPGMLDTVLNLGLGDESVEGLASVTDNERFAWDSYRRFVQMFGNVCRGVTGERFRGRHQGAEGRCGGEARHRAVVDDLRALTPLPGALPRAHRRGLPAGSARAAAPGDRGRVRLLVGDRAVEYRRINQIPDEWGTAVNVQQMVFGNKGDTSCSGVAFSRDEITGAPGRAATSWERPGRGRGLGRPYAARPARPEGGAPRRPRRAHGHPARLERHYGDMQDTEFTVEEGSLYMLQTRNAKRPAQAAVRFAVDAVDEGLLDNAGALAPSRPHASTPCSTRRSPATRSTTCWPRASPPRPGPPRARSCSRPRRPWRAAEDAAT